jgi:hypothetical protein
MNAGIREEYPLVKHLSDKQIAEMYDRYLNKENVKDLISIYSINVTPSRFVASLPPAISKKKCSTCGQKMLALRKKRNGTSAAYHGITADYYCPSCHHQLPTTACKCNSCKEKRAQKAKRRELEIKKIIREHRGEVDPIAVSELNLMDTLFLMALIDLQFSKEPTFEDRHDLKYLASVESIESSFKSQDFFYQDFTLYPVMKDLILKFYDNHIIVMSPTTESRVFQFKSDSDDSISWNVNDCRYDPNVRADHDFGRLCVSALYSELEESLEDKIELAQTSTIYHAIEICVLSECMIFISKAIEKYIDLYYSEHSFISDKAVETFFQCLRLGFSVGQVFYFIDYSARKTQEFILGNKSESYRHSYNYLLKTINEIAHRAFEQGWDVKPYSRFEFGLSHPFNRIVIKHVMSKHDGDFLKLPAKDLMRESLLPFFGKDADLNEMCSIDTTIYRSPILEDMGFLTD